MGFEGSVLMMTSIGVESDWNGSSGARSRRSGSATPGERKAAGLLVRGGAWQGFKQRGDGCRWSQRIGAPCILPREIRRVTGGCWLVSEWNAIPAVLR